MTRAPEIGFSETTSEERPHYEKPAYQARPGKSSGATKLVQVAHSLARIKKRVQRRPPTYPRS
jgi:hypothetical protein